MRHRYTNFISLGRSFPAKIFFINSVRIISNFLPLYLRSSSVFYQVLELFGSYQLLGLLLNLQWIFAMLCLCDGVHLKKNLYMNWPLILNVTVRVKIFHDNSHFVEELIKTFSVE
ncbi:unnamed protein product [Nezara viridula]|uniref:Uncharacterized protein n=1 Tax=Nezara viridula TaxID=85310 RepID=A0A9P0EDJ3_NEZVI|nr:unnamed protein product [Nezara viridula]